MISPAKISTRWNLHDHYQPWLQLPKTGVTQCARNNDVTKRSCSPFKKVKCNLKNLPITINFTSLFAKEPQHWESLLPCPGPPQYSWNRGGSQRNLILTNAIKNPNPAPGDKKTLTQVIPFAVYEVITNHPLLREVEYESFEEVGFFWGGGEVKEWRTKICYCFRF